MNNNFKRLSILMCCISILLIAGCDQSNKSSKLDQPKNLTISDNYLLSWDKVENAKSYEVRVGATLANELTCAIDLRPYLKEGENHVFVVALGDDEKYFASDAAVLVVNYTKYTKEEYNKAVENILIANNITADAAVIEKTANNLSSSLEGTNLTKENSLIIYNLMVGIKKGNIASPILRLYDQQLNYEDVAKFTYNYILKDLEEQQEAGNSNATMIYYMLSGNKNAVISTFTTAYEYTGHLANDVRNALLTGNTATPDGVYAIYQNIVAALFNEYAPNGDDVKVLTKALRNILGMLKDQGNTEIDVVALEGLLDYVEVTFDPQVSILKKTMMAIDSNTFTEIYNNVIIIINLSKEGIKVEDKQAYNDAINNIKAQVNNITIDITKEQAIINEANQKLANSTTIPYLQSLVIKLLEQQLQGNPNAPQIIEFVKILFTFNSEEIYLGRLIMQMVKILGFQETLDQFIATSAYPELCHTIIDLFNNCNTVTTTQAQFMVSVVDACLNDQKFGAMLKENNLVGVMNQIKDLVSQYDYSILTYQDLFTKIANVLINSNEFLTYIKTQPYGTAAVEVINLVKAYDPLTKKEEVLIKEILTILVNDQEITKTIVDAGFETAFNAIKNTISSYNPETESINVLIKNIINIVKTDNIVSGGIEASPNSLYIKLILDILEKIDYDNLTDEEVILSSLEVVIAHPNFKQQLDAFINANLTEQDKINLSNTATQLLEQINLASENGVSINEMSTILYNLCNFDIRILLPEGTNFESLINERAINIIVTLLNFVK